MPATLDDQPRVLEFVSRLIGDAIPRRASDIHLDPTDDGRGRVRLRIDGVLQDVEPPAPGLYPKVVSRIKIMADMDLAEPHRPQDGRILVKVRGKECDLRVSALPTVRGTRIVLRIFDREAITLDFERLGLAGDDLATVRQLIQRPHGIVLCAGPAGSGKTTVLYAMLAELDRNTRCVLSVEDPVEYRLEGVGQIQVKASIGLTSARALRSILRQDPDVILVGELRDLETARVSAQASLTGHLVVSSLHANSAPGALRRLLEMGLEPSLVNATVAGIVTSRIVRVLCPECKQEGAPAAHSLPPAALEAMQHMAGAHFCEPKGCDACKGMGYRGRTGIFEILVPDERVRKAVGASGGLGAIRNAALAAGMRPMLLSGLAKAAQGITSVQEVCRVVPHGPND